MTTATDFEIQQRLHELLTTMWLENHIELTDGPDDIDDVVTVGESAINAALDDNPSDWPLRSIYADWLEEQGNPRAESQRWMVAHCHDVVLVYYMALRLQWTIHVYGFKGIVNFLNGHIFDTRTNNTFDYQTRTAAEIDLHNALVKAGEITCALIEVEA